MRKEIAGSAKQNVAVVRQLQKKVTIALSEVDTMNLGLEHLFREIAQVHMHALKASKENDRVLRVPGQVAQLFLSGNPIELLDGDAGDIPLLWFSDICRNILRIRPELRVFVVSILGMQSSGKSTLLNALFACRFAVSVGRCSRGLFMRLLILDDETRENRNFDAILLIDTEGLGSPEKMGDAQGEKKDRLLATFAMGISNLTIINVLGENMKELTEILQIAIVTMTRLEKANISPDILMVQHLTTEKNEEKTGHAEEQFCQAIRKAIDLAEKKDVQMGVRNAECLNILFERIHDGTLLMQFHPFKDGATVNSPPSELYHKDVVKLYNKILDSSQQRTNRKAQTQVFEFKKWHSLVESYWQWVSSEDFALHFKNVQEIYDFIDRGQKIAAVQSCIAEAFHYHENELKAMVLSKAKEQTGGKSLRPSTEQTIERQLSSVPRLCSGKNECSSCIKAVHETKKLFEFVLDKPFEQETKSTIETYQKRINDSSKRRLLQIFDAAIVQHGCCADFDNIIKQRIDALLQQRKPGGFGECEKATIANEIFFLLKNAAEQMDKNPETLWDKFARELMAVYRPHPDIIKQFYNPVDFNNLFDAV